MIIVEIICGILFILLGVKSSITDIKDGCIYNKSLFRFGILGIILAICYYGYFARDLLIPFTLNFGIIAIISLVLFYSHSFAGGDCKLTMVMALLYPANYYFIYGQSDLTIVVALGIAIFYGYIYLLMSSILKLLQGRTHMTKEYIKGYLLSFFKSFISATIYISAVNLCVMYISQMGFTCNVWVIRLICIAVAWIVGRYEFLKKWYAVTIFLFVDLVVGFMVGHIPFSINPENYILVIILLLCQMTIKTNIYEEVQISDLKKGMILSSLSSIMMQNSRVRGLPKISTEDLKSRLTETEIDSIKRWAEGRKIESVAVVKKIPFALFIFLGFISYFVMWGVVR